MTPVTIIFLIVFLGFISYIIFKKNPKKQTEEKNTDYSGSPKITGIKGNPECK